MTSKFLVSFLSNNETRDFFSFSVTLDKTYKTENYFVSTVELISDFRSTSWFDNIRVFRLLQPLRVRQLLSQLPRGQGWRGRGQLRSSGQGKVISDTMTIMSITRVSALSCVAALSPALSTPVAPLSASGCTPHEATVAAMT